MHAEEVVLFVIVTALSFALVATIVAPLIRKRRPPDAARPEAAPGGLSAIEGPRCPSCRRGLLPGFNFCPFDGTPLAAERPRAARPAREAVTPAAVPRKVCPRCARGYQQDTAVCASDGAPLVPVN